LLDDGGFAAARCSALRKRHRSRRRVIAWQRTRGHINHGHQSCRVAFLNAIHLGKRHPALRHIFGDRFAHRRRRTREIHGGQRSPHALRLARHQFQLLLVVIACDCVGRRQQVVHLRIEPAVYAVANHLTADQQNEHRRDDRHSKKNGDELRAKTGKWQATPTFDEELDDVAGEDEHKRNKNRQVGR
jgi:hypothetical protein